MRFDYNMYTGSMLEKYFSQKLVHSSNYKEIGSLEKELSAKL